MGFADLFKNYFLGGGSIQSGIIFENNNITDETTDDTTDDTFSYDSTDHTTDDTSDEEFEVLEANDANNATHEELETLAENPEHDEYDLYGESVASKLRLIELAEVKNRVKGYIDSVISDAILGQGIYGELTRKITRYESTDSDCVSSSSCMFEETKYPKRNSESTEIIPLRYY